jgi:tetratricopeptide (TPR) repeat protein
LYYSHIKKKNHRLKLWALSLCVIASLIALGSGMFGEGSEVGPGETPFSTPPEGNTSSSSKVPSFTKVVPPQEVYLDEAGPRKPQPSDPSVTDDKRASESRPSPLHLKKTSGKIEDLGNKAPIFQSTDEGVNVARGQAPQMLHTHDDAERLSQASSLVRKRLYLKAIEVLEPLFASPPKKWGTWFWMGTAQMGLGRYEEAREYFREGLARDETIPELWVQCALVEHQRGKYPQALSLLRQAELLSPTLPQVHLNLAFTLESQGNTSSALRHYRQYLSLTKRNPSYFSTRQKVLDRILNLEAS